MKNNDDARLLANKRRIDAERKAAAIERAKQQFLRDTTPGVATPMTVNIAAYRSRMKRLGL